MVPLLPRTKQRASYCYSCWNKPRRIRGFLCVERCMWHKKYSSQGNNSTQLGTELSTLHWKTNKKSNSLWKTVHISLHNAKTGKYIRLPVCFLQGLVQVAYVQMLLLRYLASIIALLLWYDKNSSSLWLLLTESRAQNWGRMAQIGAAQPGDKPLDLA